MMRTSKRLLLVSEEFPPHVGGAGSVAYQNARRLSQVFEVDVLTRSRNGMKAKVKNESFRLFEAPTVPKLWALPFAWHLMRQKPGGYDVILLNDIGATYVAGLALSRQALRKSLVYTHGGEPEKILSTPDLSYRVTGITTFYRRALCHCHRVIAVSEYQKKRFHEAIDTQQFGAKTEVVYAGVDRSVFYKEPSEHLDSKLRQHGTPVLLSASRVEAEKGYPAMYRIFRKLHEQGIFYRWVIAGSGDYLNVLKAKVQRDRLEEYVVFTGALTQAELRQYYSVADVFWLLSELPEAFGLVYLEANACGTPVIARRRAGATEAISEGESGFLIDTDEQCFRLLLQQAYASLNERNIELHVDKFRTEIMVEQLAELFPN